MNSKNFEEKLIGNVLHFIAISLCGKRLFETFFNAFKNKSREVLFLVEDNN